MSAFCSALAAEVMLAILRSQIRDGTKRDVQFLRQSPGVPESENNDGQ